MDNFIGTKNCYYWYNPSSLWDDFKRIIQHKGLLPLGGWNSILLTLFNENDPAKLPLHHPVIQSAHPLAHTHTHIWNYEIIYHDVSYLKGSYLNLEIEEKCIIEKLQSIFCQNVLHVTNYALISKLYRVSIQ